MKSTVKFLVILLVAQIILSLGIPLSSKDMTAKSVPVNLLTFDEDSVDKLIISGPDDSHVQLANIDGRWVLPQKQNFPANTAKVEQLLAQLSTTQVTHPVATSKSAQKRFHVSDNTFERRITLKAADKTLTQVYLGSSAAMQQVHARTDKSDDIYAIKMATYTIPVDSNDWVDKSLVQIDKSAITDLTVNGLGIQRSTVSAPEASEPNEHAEPGLSPAWEAPTLAANKKLDNDGVNTLVGLIANIQYDAVLGKDNKAEYHLSTPLLSLTVTTDKQDDIDYQIGKDDNDRYILKVSTRPEYFALADYRATALIDAAANDKLTPMTEKEQDSAVEH
ncbi:DUF4340 domain-containing protein [Alteromonas sp. C1M14]|uniref:DUF4340 domain-containing protein n=1 Tax=Alteromonas sp. C1M14 TaxID=2841567 RepID=UPI001C08FE22|nr:DUF4340 domain-containing protein [Alteromonas sp. C1M14]MBU2979135.1 DUF4340 domain-containing protein [Alteromonas sp. C1M14]